MLPDAPACRFTFSCRRSCHVSARTSAESFAIGRLSSLVVYFDNQSVCTGDGEGLPRRETSANASESAHAVFESHRQHFAFSSISGIAIGVFKTKPQFWGVKFECRRPNPLLDFRSSNFGPVLERMRLVAMTRANSISVVPCLAIALVAEQATATNPHIRSAFGGFPRFVATKVQPDRRERFQTPGGIFAVNVIVVPVWTTVFGGELEFVGVSRISTSISVCFVLLLGPAGRDLVIGFFQIDGCRLQTDARFSRCRLILPRALNFSVERVPLVRFSSVFAAAWQVGKLFALNRCRRYVLKRRDGIDRTRHGKSDRRGWAVALPRIQS